MASIRPFLYNDTVNQKTSGEIRWRLKSARLFDPLILATVAQLVEQRFCNLRTTRAAGSKTRVPKAHFLSHFLSVAPVSCAHRGLPERGGITSPSFAGGLAAQRVATTHLKGRARVHLATLR